MDKGEAIKWYKLSAQKGFSRAQYNLGVMYRDGDGVPRDYREAHKWFLQAAEQDDWRAQVKLTQKALKPLANKANTVTRR
jgi:TPR repeat protein